MPISTAVIGASGYMGAELLRLLANHPEIDVRVITAQTQVGHNAADVYPHLSCYGDLPLLRLDDVENDLATCRLVFSALPHGEAMRILPDLDNEVVIDLGGDFRLEDAETYERWYDRPHAAPDALDDWTYGLTELFRDDIVDADRIANPGCYPTAATLAIVPLVAAGLLEGPIVVDAMSGTSGAGRTPKPNLHFSHVAENVEAYRLTSHQHTPEIEYAIALATDSELQVSFTAHIVPMARGLHATVSAQMCPGTRPGDPAAALEAAYGAENFVTVCDKPPGTKQVRGSNNVALYVAVDERVGRVIVTSVIDNLVKGGAGQAIQNANLVFGLSETLGLPTEGLYP